MYKCALAGCNGAWGTSHELSAHLHERKHFESYLKEVRGVDNDLLVNLSEEEVADKVSEFSDPDWSKMKTLHDQVSTLYKLFSSPLTIDI